MEPKTPATTPAKSSASADEASRMLETQPPASALQETQPPAASGEADLQSTQAHLARAPQQDTPASGKASRSNAVQPLQETQAQVATQSPVGATQAGPAPADTTGSQAKVKKLDRLGEYKLLKKLGAGGMGEVYKGFQESLDREVAIKVLFKHLATNADFVQRFQREARIMAKLDHPNILRCYGVGEQAGFHYFAMEFIDGGSMQDVLDKRGKLRVGDALHVILACTRALAHAHELNMVHRDIKPDNVLLTRKGVIKLADLGLAKAHGENVNLTRTGTGAGTPIYMSPEQARDAKHVDHRTDIYSLGCMLYTFLAGKPPFAGETYVELFEAKEKGRFEPVRKSNIEVPERLDLMIDKMVAKKPEHRYQTCAELIKDLEGLGLSSATLTFIEEKSVPSTAAAPAAPAKGVAKPASAGSGAALKKPAASSQQPAKGPSKNIWHLSYHTGDGKLLRRKLTTDQVRDLIRDPDFDLKAQATHDPKDGYRALATFAEFEQAMRGRLEKERADRKTVKFKDIYKKLEKEEIQRKKWRWLRDLYRSAGNWVLFLIYLAVIGGVLFGGYWVVRRYLWEFFMAWFNRT